MQRLLAGIRWRLVGWTMLVVGVILLLLGTTVYGAVSRSLIDQVDRNLLSRSEQAIPLGLDRRFRGPEGFRGGVFYLAVGGDGSLLANPQGVDITADEIPPPATRAPFLGTIDVNGEDVRIVVRPMPDGGRLIVGQSLAAEQRAQRSLLLVLLAGGVAGLILSFGGAWFLAGRALVPIHRAFVRQQEFVADASHELRTPLTVMQSTTDVLDQHRDEPLQENGELFDDLRQEIGRTVRLTNDLLTLARSDQGELELMVAPLDLSALAQEVVRRTTPLAQSRGVALALHSEGESPCVDVDPDRIQQVILILLDNAIKHTPPDGRVEVRVHQQGGSALLEVADTGAGIAPEELDRIFDRFYRADAARSRESGGTGLGLAIARMLVEAHGGSIGASSTPGAGTCVTVRLPLAGREPSLGGRLGALTARLASAQPRR